MSEKERHLHVIEALRLELYKTAEGKSLMDPQVLNVSRMLDAVLNEYQRQLSKKPHCCR